LLVSVEDHARPVWIGRTRVHEPERQAFARERQEYERAKGEMLSEIARLEAELGAVKEASEKAAKALSEERDRFESEAQGLRVTLATVEGALGEARKRADEEQGRARELSERVITEAARAESLAARVTLLEAGGKNEGRS
jgi:hypothetical protein